MGDRNKRKHIAGSERVGNSYDVATRDLHQVLFPDDWMPDEATTPVPT